MSINMQETPKKRFSPFSLQLWALPSSSRQLSSCPSNRLSSSPRASFSHPSSPPSSVPPSSHLFLPA